MRGGGLAGGRRRGRPPDGANCSRRAGLQQCKSFVEICIVSCLSAAPACVCGRVSSEDQPKLNTKLNPELNPELNRSSQRKGGQPRCRRNRSTFSCSMSIRTATDRCWLRFS